jgi:transglutaminase-like putative cysteine protease
MIPWLRFPTAFVLIGLWSSPSLASAIAPVKSLPQQHRPGDRPHPAQLTEPINTRYIGVSNDPRKKPLEDIRIEDYETDYAINADYSYRRTIATRLTLLTPGSLQAWQRASYVYYPDTQGLKLVEAYVIQPDGKRVAIAPSNIFTRPSQESQDAPGFDSSLTTTVVFPQLQVGSQTYVKWEFTQKKPPVIGLDEVDMPDFRNSSRRETIRVTAPADLKLRWAKRGDYAVTDEPSDQGKTRTITAVLTGYQGRQPESGMTNSVDVSPLFMFSNLDRWEDLGKIYWQQSQPKIQVTPEVQALANKITGNKTGLEAARAIYNWVTQNVEYVAVYLSEDAGWVPHDIPEILKNGYGDCKDHVALLQVLLKAKDIESIPTIIDWGSQYSNLPLPGSQFNHAIIYLPQFDLFANPTDKHAAFGELDTSLSGKFVVLATPEGKTATTPASKSTDNRYKFQGQMAIAPDGTITGTGQIAFQGQGSNSARQFFSADTPEQIADNILSATPEGGYGSLKTSDLQDLSQPVSVRSTWISPKAITLGNQAFLTVPVGLNVRHPGSLRGYISYSDRLYPIIVGAQTMEWDYQIQLPKGYQISRMPAAIDFRNEAGSYRSQYQQSGDKLTIQRQLVLAKDVYPAEAYKAFEDVIYKPIRDFRDILVLQRKS